MALRVLGVVYGCEDGSNLRHRVRTRMSYGQWVLGRCAMGYQRQRAELCRMGSKRTDKRGPNAFLSSHR